VPVTVVLFRTARCHGGACQCKLLAEHSS